MIKIFLTDGKDIFDTKKVKNQVELEKLNEQAKFASDGNVYWIQLESHQNV